MGAQLDPNMLDMLVILGCYGIDIKDCTYFDLRPPEEGGFPYCLVFRHSFSRQPLELDVFSDFDCDGFSYTCVSIHDGPCTCLDWRMVDISSVREVL